MFVLSAALLASVVFFQSRSDAQFRRMSPDDRAAALKDSLGLDSNQVLKVKKIYQDAQAQMQTAMESNQGDRDAIRSAMTTINDKTDVSIKELLTADQKTKYEAMVKNRAAMRNRMRGGN